MPLHVISKVLPVMFLSFLLANCGNEESSDKTSDASSQQAAQAEGVISQVGDQAITYNEIGVLLNSSAMVGLSIPALGSPDRYKVMVTLLDKLISSNLLYLDAKAKGTDGQTAYTSGMKKFEDAVIVTMYRSKVLFGDIPVSEEEIVAYYKSNVDPDNELTDDLKLLLEAKIRKNKFLKLKASMSERLRAGTEIRIFEDVLSIDADDNRSDADVVASIGDKKITWSDVEVPMRAADERAKLAEFLLDNDEERLTKLQEYIEYTLMVDKALAAGLKEDPEFIKRTAEYRKNHLINVHRNGLIKSWQPSDDELKTTFVDNMEQITIPEQRKVQTVVVKTKEEADRIKAEIDSGKITMFKAAQDYSIDPAAKSNLGDLGWVSQGTGFEELDEFTFNLEPEVVGGPVETPAGWQLMKVLDVNDAKFEYFDDPLTRKLVYRLYMKNRFNDYVVDLRKNHFKVAVYEDELTRLFQKEVNYIAELTEKAKQEDSVTEKRVEELQKWVEPPALPTK